MKKGRNLIISLDGNAIAAAKECNIDYDVDMQQVSTLTSSTAKTYVAKRTGWNISVNGLVPNAGISNLMTTIKARNLLTVSVTDGTTTYSGSAYMTSLSVSGNVGNIATYQCKLQGTGELA